MFVFRLKEEDANHQYTFQSVDKSERYPLGVMTTYRAFVQDEDFEILKKTVDSSANPLSLGLEP
jgi:hypothetical protein